MDGARDQFLAGAVLTVNEHAAIGRRRHRHLLAKLPHRVALADHRARLVHARTQRAVLVLQPPLPKRVADDEHGLVERQRLFDEIERAEFDGADGRFDVAVAGDQDDLRIDLPLAQPRERREAVHAGQPHVQDDQIDRRARDALETGFPAGHRFDAVALVAQHAGQRTADTRFIVNDQDGRLH